MPDIDLAKLAERAKDAPEPIKRTVDRTAKPNPLQPLLAESWEHRSTRGKSEVGSTKQIRSYSDAETLAIVRALRRAGDALNLGVRIDAPSDAEEVAVMVKDEQGNETETQATDEQGNPVFRTRLKYRPGTVRFEAVTRQKRTRQNGEQTEPAPEQASEDTGYTEEDSDAQAEQDARLEPEPSF